MKIIPNMVLSVILDMILFIRIIKNVLTVILWIVICSNL